MSSKFGVRPALGLSNLETLQPGEKLKFSEQTFTYLGEGLALCDDFIGKYAFRENWKASDANIYETSDVKKYVDEWFEKEMVKAQEMSEPDIDEPDR